MAAIWDIGLGKQVRPELCRAEVIHTRDAMDQREVLYGLLVRYARILSNTTYPTPWNFLPAAK
jgi:hypothetical protein